MILFIEEVEQKIKDFPYLQFGCIIDTNILFAASFPLDTHNEWSEKVFTTFHRLNIPLYTNLNVRSEFIDLNRRVLIPEGLVDFYEDYSNLLPKEILVSLKSLKTRKSKATEQNRTFKFNDAEIKQYRQLLEKFKISNGENAWTYFCQYYLFYYIKGAWERTTTNLRIQFLGTREIQNKAFFDRHPSWSKMVQILGLSGVGSSDAMIINLFLESKIPIITTADYGVRNTLLNYMGKDKYILAP